MNLRPGQISSRVRTSLGFHIIQAVDAKPARPMTFDEVSSEIGGRLENEKRREAVQKLNVDLSAGVRLVAGSSPGGS
jgi:parvulin-like peptidyl-prolyl isomerase